MFVCTICARGGSKGLPGKNVRPLGGRPLIAHTIEQALASGIFEVIVVSSDNDLILEVARQYSSILAISRPPEWATDESSKLPAIRHALDCAEGHAGKTAKIVVDLSVTAPLRRPQDIIDAVALLERTKASNVLSGSIASSSPYFSQVELDEAGHVALCIESDYVRRQDAPVTYDLNGSIYAWRRDKFVEQTALFYHDTRLFEMPSDRSVDIDTELDFRLAECLFEDKNRGTFGVEDRPAGGKPDM